MTLGDMEIIITHLPIYIGLVIVYLGSVFLSLISGKYTYLIISSLLIIIFVSIYQSKTILYITCFVVFVAFLLFYGICEIYHKKQIKAIKKTETDPALDKLSIGTINDGLLFFNNQSYIVKKHKDIELNQKQVKVIKTKGDYAYIEPKEIIK